MKVISTFVNLLLLAGSTLLLLFLILSGSTVHFPFDRFYWIRAETSEIANAYDQSAWTFWGVCDYNDFSSCITGPAFPLSPADNFGTNKNIPADFIDNRNTYYYLSRFAFAFFLIAVGFSAFALLISILGFCFEVIDKVLIFLVVIGLFFVAGAAAFQTAVVVLARNAFHSQGLRAHIGVKSMAIAWAAVAVMLLVFFITCAANIANSYKKHIDRVNESRGYDNEAYASPAAHAPLGDDSSFTRGNASEKNDAESGGIRFFRIKRNQKPSDDESV
ncbi:hypothetical protein JCM33374_g3013 [Metschnikowia sp. JCM 33374]|nr:hypothetical protein JCM33374_g3013 [Metschnikowia sp. JCM 33374]